MRVFMVSPGTKPGKIPPISGGIDAYEYNLSRQLVDLGHEVHIMRRRFPYLPLEEKVEGIHVHRIEVNEQSERLALISYSLRVAKKLSRLTRRKEDIIHCHERTSGIGVFLFRIHKRAPVIFTEHNWDSLVGSKSFFDNWLLYRVNLWADEFMIKHSDKVFAISRAMRRTIIDKVGVPHEKVVTTPNSIDTDKLKPGFPDPAIRKKLSVSDEPLILFVGRLDPEKGIDYLIEAMAFVKKSMPSAKLVICGKGKDGSSGFELHLRKLARELASSVIFLGRISRPELIEVYKACDVFVLSSLFEVMPTVVLEAMAFAKPVVATDIPGTNEVVRNRETGMLTKPGNTKQLADVLITFLKNRELAESMGKNGRNVVETFFSWDKNVKRIIREYENALLNKN